MVETQHIGGKPVHIVSEHHHVLLPWSRWRRASGRPAWVLTLDHHTDVLPPYGDRPSAGFEYGGDRQVLAAIAALRHDEHLAWAVAAGVAAECLVIAQQPAAVSPAPGTRVSCDPDWPELSRFFAGDPAARRMAAGWLDSGVLAPQLKGWPGMAEEAPLILDFDLDSIPCLAALDPRDRRVWRRLVRRAELITVSREEEWLKLLRFPGENFTCDQALEGLLKLIAEALEE